MDHLGGVCPILKDRDCSATHTPGLELFTQKQSGHSSSTTTHQSGSESMSADVLLPPARCTASYGAWNRAYVCSSSSDSRSHPGEHAGLARADTLKTLGSRVSQQVSAVLALLSQKAGSQGLSPDTLKQAKLLHTNISSTPGLLSFALKPGGLKVLPNRIPGALIPQPQTLCSSRALSPLWC